MSYGASKTAPVALQWGGGRHRRHLRRDGRHSMDAGGQWAAATAVERPVCLRVSEMLERKQSRCLSSK